MNLNRDEFLLLSRTGRGPHSTRAGPRTSREHRTAHVRAAVPQAVAQRPDAAARDELRGSPHARAPGRRVHAALADAARIGTSRRTTSWSSSSGSRPRKRRCCEAAGRPGRGGPRLFVNITGVSPTADRRDFAADEALLTDVLREVIAIGDGVGGARVLRLLDDAVALGREARLGDERAADRLAELVAGLTLDETEVLVRSLTRWFQLVNLAEDNERVRRLRARDAADPERPRAGSLRQVVRRPAPGRRDRGGARGGAQQRRAAAGDDRPSDRGAPAHHDRQARARVRRAARARRALPRARRRRAAPPAGHGAGAVGIRRSARRRS